MCQGRCAGCHRTGPHREIAAHLAQCADFAALYRDAPERALDPGEELERWRREDRSSEHAALVDSLRGRSEAVRAVQAGRFAWRDPLEE